MFRSIRLALVLFTSLVLATPVVWAQQAPPPQAFEDCAGKKAGDKVQHMTREGSVEATCENSPDGLVARPTKPRGRGGDEQPQYQQQPSRPQDQPSQQYQQSQRQEPSGQGQQSRQGENKYSLAQAISDNAQLHTIAFDGLAFLTGNFGYDTFLPPGKVCDYFGFQYMRDIDANGRGHNTSFLTRIANNMLGILNQDQRAKLMSLAKAQEPDIRRFAEMRFPLIKAFRQNLEGNSPSGSGGLNKKAVMEASANLYALDGLMAFQRAQVMGEVIRSLTPDQKAALAKLKFGDSSTWPDSPDSIDKRGMSHEAHVAVMTYASEMFSWYAGSLEADVYFCPERHGMYFGGFGMKTAPAMGKRDYSISTSLTGDSGADFLATLNDIQRKQITGLVDLQRQDLAEIVKVRRAIAMELRLFQKGDKADKNDVIAHSKRYGELDGEMSYLYATAFAKVGQSLTAQQKARLMAMRSDNPSDPKGPFLYSSPISLPKVENANLLFTSR